MDLHKEHVAQTSKKLILSRAEFERLQEENQKVAVYTVKRKSLEEKEHRNAQLHKENLSLQDAIKELKDRIEQVKEQLEGMDDLEQTYQKLRKELEQAQGAEREVEIQFNKMLERKEGIIRSMNELAEEIEKKEIAHVKVKRLQEVHHWLTEYFMNTMEAIERQVFARVYHEFNSLFEHWFTLLVEDAVLIARLDDSFTPVLQQNGYDTRLEHLSGGEKTACALAYRLALNKVINGLITNIQTKDLLILDEPTDGFSAEQLDKMREVLQELGQKQVVIVSHEPKIESFVDHVLKVRKLEHVSTIEA